MSVIVFCNVGTRDVTLGQEEKLLPRALGEQYLAQLPTQRDAFQFPILHHLLQEVLHTHGGYIDQMIFIGTDQKNEKFRARDTCHFATLLADVLPERFPGQIGRAEVAIIDGDVNPSLYDEAFDALGPMMMRYMTADPAATCVILPVGGIPACNTALILQGVRLYGARCHIFYQSEEGVATPLQVGAKVLGVLQENTLLAALGRYEFATAVALWQKSAEPQPVVGALLHYGAARLRFDFAAADAHLQQAVQVARGAQRQEVQAIRQAFQQFRQGNDLARIGELHHNARICWENGLYVDFLGRAVRFFTAVLAHELSTQHPAGEALLPRVAEPEVHGLLLHLLAQQAQMSGAQPDVDTAVLVSFKAFLEQAFNLAELGDLCFDLGIDPENIAGQTKPERTQALILYAQRRSQLPQLMAAATAQRRDNGWTPPTALAGQEQAVVVAALQRLERLVALRDQSIIGQGYGGVSLEIIQQVYAASSDDDADSAAHTAVGDMAAICTALGIAIANPFRELNGVITNMMHSAR